MKQLHTLGTFDPVEAKNLSRQQKQKALSYLVFLKEKGKVARVKNAVRAAE